MVNFLWTFWPVWWTCDLKVDIYVSETSLTVCQQQRIGTERCGKRNQFWRRRRSREHSQKKKGGDELSFPSIDKKSRLLTKNLFPVCVIYAMVLFTSAQLFWLPSQKILLPYSKETLNLEWPLIWPRVQSIWVRHCLHCNQKQLITITEKHGIKYVFIWNSVSQSVISSVSQFIKFERVWKGGATFP